jgi:hypothetical protein
MSLEIRASEIKVGHRVTEDGYDHIVVAKLDQHGDTMLITGPNGDERSFDIDTVVEVDLEHGAPTVSTMTEAQLYSALVQLCQAYGVTNEYTYEKLQEAIDSIQVDPDEETP